MRTSVTSGCTAREHPEFAIAFDPDAVVESDVDVLVRYFEEAVANGGRFSPDETVRLGSGLLKIRGGVDGQLTLEEPDFQAMPIRWVRGVTRTLQNLRLEKEVVESVLSSDDFVPSPLDHSCVTCVHSGPHQTFVMEREVPEGADTGWVVVCEHPEDHGDNDFRRVSVYEAMLWSPGITQFLALPPGTSVLVGTEYPEIERSGELLEFRQGSFLDRLYP